MSLVHIELNSGFKGFFSLNHHVASIEPFHPLAGVVFSFLELFRCRTWFIAMAK